jgi:hypothetical protein
MLPEAHGKAVESWAIGDFPKGLPFLTQNLFATRRRAISVWCREENAANNGLRPSKTS